jgi:hypothetical protein
MDARPKPAHEMQQVAAWSEAQYGWDTLRLFSSSTHWRVRCYRKMPWRSERSNIKLPIKELQRYREFWLMRDGRAIALSLITAKI